MRCSLDYLVLIRSGTVIGYGFYLLFHTMYDNHNININKAFEWQTLCMNRLKNKYKCKESPVSVFCSTTNKKEKGKGSGVKIAD